MAQDQVEDWQHSIQRRRAALLNRLLLAAIIFCFIALTMMTPPETPGVCGFLAAKAVFIVGWILLLVFWLWRGLGYTMRVIGLLLLNYLFSVYLMYVSGLDGSGRLWLLLLPALAFIFVGPRGGVVAGAVSLVTYGVFFAMIALLVWAPVDLDNASLPHWISEGGDFLVIIVGLMIVLWSYNRSWREALVRSSEANLKLDRALQEVQELNRELDRRVEQRTGELKAVLDSIADGVVVFDRERRVTLVNPAAVDLLGYPVEAMLQEDMEEFLRVGEASLGRQKVAQIIAQRDSAARMAFEWLGKTLSASVAPVHLDSGETFGTVAVFHDFTQQAEIDRMKDAFLLIASHDLRSPLSAILGYTQLLDMDAYGPLSKTQRDVVARIASNVHYMASLANTLLGRAQIEAGTLETCYMTFSPLDLVAEVADRMLVLAEAKKLTLDFEVDQAVPPSLKSDTHWLQHILTNLVGNALKYTTQGGVQLRVYLPDAGHWAVAVSDTGPGIPESELEDVFDPFCRLDQTIEEGKSRGAGLGLAIVNQLVACLDGQIDLQSTIGEGSCFTVILPLASSAHSTEV